MEVTLELYQKKSTINNLTTPVIKIKSKFTGSSPIKIKLIQIKSKPWPRSK